MNSLEVLDMMSGVRMNTSGRLSKEVLNLVGKVLGCFFMQEVPGVGIAPYGSVG